MNKRAIILTNLGSPDSTSVPDLKKYLGQFLMDERVIDLPKWFRSFLVNQIILRTRPKKSAEKYKTILTDDGQMPLVVYTQKIADKLRKKITEPLYISMRYGNPSSKDVIAKIQKEHPNVSEIFLIPLYPHYAISSYETAVVDVEKETEKLGMTLKVLPPFYDNPNYIKALSESIKPHIETKKNDKIIFSYHGIPVRHLRKPAPNRSKALRDTQYFLGNGDSCYQYHTRVTTKLVQKALDIEKSKVILSYQSRFGFDPWLKPSTSETIKKLGQNKTQNLLVVCPAFVCDCLETIEEIGQEGAEDFHKYGGGAYHRIECLNDHDLFIDFLEKEIKGS